MNNRKGDESGRDASVEDELPLTITNISVQKKNSGRYSIYHNKKFLAGVSRKTLVDFSLAKGVELTPFLFKQITESEEYEAARNACLRYLGRRDHASAELRTKMNKKGIRQSITDQVLDELTDKGFINDRNFAVAYATEKAELNRWGPKKIMAALYKKGIQKNAAEFAVKKVTENLPQQQICVDLALKRRNHFLREENPYKRKQKIYNYLAGRGFSGSDIKSALPAIMADLNAEESDT